MQSVINIVTGVLDTFDIMSALSWRSRHRPVLLFARKSLPGNPLSVIHQCCSPFKLVLLHEAVHFIECFVDFIRIIRVFA
jgi:hypothetical protein